MFTGKKIEANYQAQASCKGKKKNRSEGFFQRINPFNWFNGLSDITISLKEFDNKKPLR